MTDGYRPAAICRRGHVVTSDMTLGGLLTDRCAECGARVLTACPTCEKSIRGRYRVEGVLDLTSKYSPPNFCADCGGPFPWVGREGRIYELMNRLDEEELDPADELAVREQLEALMDPNLDEAEQRERWQKIKNLAPTLWQQAGAQKILETVMSAAIKTALGLQ